MKKLIFSLLIISISMFFLIFNNFNYRNVGYVINHFNAKCKGTKYVCYIKGEYYYFSNGGIYKYNNGENVKIANADYYCNGIASDENNIFVAYENRIESIDLHTYEKTVINSNVKCYLLTAKNGNLFCVQSLNDFSENTSENMYKYNSHGAENITNKIPNTYNNKLNTFYDGGFTYLLLNNTIVGVADTNENIFFQSGFDEYLISSSELLYTYDEGKSLWYLSNFQNYILDSIPDNYVISANNMYSEDDFVYALLQDNNTDTVAGNYNIKQKLHNADAVAKIDVINNQCQIIYETKDPDERIIAYVDGNIVLYEDGNVAVTSLGTNTVLQSYRLGKGKDYMFEVCNDNIFIWDNEFEMVRCFNIFA